MEKYKIYSNGKYIESFPTLEQAKMRVERYERMDKYELSIGYTNPLPTYEIRM